MKKLIYLIFLPLLMLSTQSYAIEVFLDCVEESQKKVGNDYAIEVCSRLPESKLCERAKRGCQITKGKINFNRVLFYEFMCYPPAPGFQDIVQYQVQVDFDGQSCDLNLKVTGSWDD